MKIRILSIIAVIAGISLIWGTSAPTHSGRTDSSGGHHNRKTGGYHYHNGGATRTSRTVKAPSRSRSVTTLPAEPRWHNPSSPDFYKKWSDNLVDREIALTERELALDKRENLLRERERAVTERERAVSATHIALTEQAAAFTIKEQNLLERELNLAKKVINVHVTQCMRVCLESPLEESSSIEHPSLTNRIHNPPPQGGVVVCKDTPCKRAQQALSV